MNQPSNPFETPNAAPATIDDDPDPVLVPEGSFGVGFALGFILGLWGLLGCLIFAKRETKRGSGIGFLSRIGVTLVIVAIMAAVN